VEIFYCKVIVLHYRAVELLAAAELLSTGNHREVTGRTATSEMN
jgi:hypothetical protein